MPLSARRRSALLGAVATAGAIAAVVVLPGRSGSKSLPAKTFHVVGGLTLALDAANDPSGTDQYTMTGTSEGSCAGVGGYEDLATGTTVLARDQAGHEIARTELGDGRSASNSDLCRWQFALDLPVGRTSYLFVVGTRTSPRYTQAELQRDGLNLSVGQ